MSTENSEVLKIFVTATSLSLVLCMGLIIVIFILQKRIIKRRRSSGNNHRQKLNGFRKYNDNASGSPDSSKSKRSLLSSVVLRGHMTEHKGF